MNWWLRRTPSGAEQLQRLPVPVPLPTGFIYKDRHDVADFNLSQPEASKLDLRYDEMQRLRTTMPFDRS